MFSFLTNTAQNIRGKTEAVKFMKRNLVYNELEISNVEKFGNRSSQLEKSAEKELKVKALKNKKKKKKKHSFVSSDSGWLSDAVLPDGWKYRELGDTKVLLSPDGKELRGISAAIRFLVSENSTHEVVQMRKFLARFGWRPDPTLPEAWYYKKGVKRYDYCSPSGDIFKSKHQVDKYLRSK